MRSSIQLSGALLGALLSPLPAQNFDLIGVTFQGAILRIDSATGATQQIGTAPLGSNCLAVARDERIWTTVRSGSVAPFQHHLAVINPVTGVVTQPFGSLNVGDLRGMTADNSGNLLAIRDGAASDELVRIDVTNGAVSVIGPTGFTGLQGLDRTALGLKAWDLTAGLVRVDALTGAATDQFPGVGGPAGLQWLATDPETSICLVGRTTLQTVDLFNGTVGLPIAISGAPDLRGVEFTTSRLTAFGTGCGPSPRLGGEIVAGGPGVQLLATISGPHSPGVLGALVIGLSNTSHLGQPLPISIDPLIGTSGCSLAVSVDATLFSFTDGTGHLRPSIGLPTSLAWFVLFAQHAVFEPTAPGGVVTTHGLRVRTSL